MLKLERNTRNGMINIIIRDKEYLFTSSFLIALAIAIGIHFILILLFHVVPFKMSWNDKIFTPTQVESDAILGDSAVAIFNPSLQTLRGLPPLPPSRPTLLRNPKFLAAHPITYTLKEHPSDYKFIQIEQPIYQPEFNPIVYHELQKPLKINISGILGQFEPISTIVDNLSMPQFTFKDGSQRVIFSVLVEGKNGKIFWFETIERAPDVAMNRYAEKILREMKFPSDPNLMTIRGNIEMQFNGNKIYD